MRPRARLAALSFLLLFVELALIRWTGTQVLYLSYFSNFVLLGSFLGMGLGFLWSGRGRPLIVFAPPALLALVAFLYTFPVRINQLNPDILYFGSTRASGLPIWVMLPIVFAACAAVMATIADELGRVFRKFAPLEAYRLDVMGSLGGIAAFSLLAFLHAAPLAWGTVVAV